MWTWTAIFALAFVIQGSLGVPTFGTGPQQEWWNEVDDEYPGEIHIPDDVTPLSDFDYSNNDEQELSLDNTSSAPNTTPISPDVDFLPAPTPTPRPPTVLDLPEEDPSQNSEPKESHQPTSSIPSPPVSSMMKDALTNTQSQDLRHAEGEVSRSGAGNLENNEVIKNPDSFTIHPKYIVTVRPNKVDKPIDISPIPLLKDVQGEDGLEEQLKEVAEVMDSLSSPTKEDMHQSTSMSTIPRLNFYSTPTGESSSVIDLPEENTGKYFDIKDPYKLTSSIPAPPVPIMSQPTEDNLINLQATDVLNAKGELPELGEENFESNRVIENPGSFVPHPKYIVTGRPEKLEKDISAPLLTLMRGGKEGEGLEDIFKDVAKVVDSLSSRSKEDMHQSPSIPPVPHLNKNNEITDKNKEAFDIISRVLKRQSLAPPFEDIQSHKSNDYGNKDSPSREEYFQMKLSPKVVNAPTTKTIKRVLLKSLVPRQYFVVKDIYDILKARAIASSNNAEGHELFNPDLLQGLKNNERYVAVARERSPYTNLPQLYFPNREKQFVKSKFEPDPEIPDFDEFIKPNFSEDQLISRYREILNQFLNLYQSRQRTSYPLKNPVESDKEDDSDSKMENLFNFLQNEFGAQEDTMDKDPEIPLPLERFFLAEEEDPSRYIPLNFHQ